MPYNYTLAWEARNNGLPLMRAMWIHYPEGAGTSKLTPSLIDRAIGSPGTARNWNTVLKLEEMLAA